MSDERRGRRNPTGEELIPRATQKIALPPPPPGMPLPGMPLASAAPAPLSAERPSRSLPGEEEPTPDLETVARQAAHAAAQLTQLPPSETPVVRNTMVFHKAQLGFDSSDLVRVHRAPPVQRIDPRFIMLGAPDSPASASFRVLRHRLAERQDVKVILVTSPRAVEGKTTCAVNLALALGEAGRARVLLLEANFRRPSLGPLLGFHPPICLSEQLELHRAHPMQPWVVVEAAVPWLHTAVVAHDNRSRPLLDGAALALCLDELRRAGYDYIVVDSPPILGSADVNLIEESVDGIVVTMWARRSRARALRKAIDQIGRSKLLGVVLLGS